MSFLLDTNIVSELRRGTKTPAALLEWFREQAAEALYLSVITFGEIRQGVEQRRRRDPAQAQVLNRWLDVLARHYTDRVLPIDHAVADDWGRLRAVRSLPVIDAFLAATARVNGLTLVTRNDRAFRGLDVPVINPMRS